MAFKLKNARNYSTLKQLAKCDSNSSLTAPKSKRQSLGENSAATERKQINLALNRS